MSEHASKFEAMLTAFEGRGRRLSNVERRELLDAFIPELRATLDGVRAAFDRIDEEIEASRAAR